jgi:hypothetical protein
MHQVDARIHHFYVSNRNLWNENTGDIGTWEEFITGGEDGMDVSTVPVQATSGAGKDLWDYLGVPSVAGISLNALPIRAVNFIWNEWYRDQDLQTERSLADVTIPRCTWEKDYTSTARPWSQKGPAVSIPVGDRAPVEGLGKSTQVWDVGGNVYETGGTGTTMYDSRQQIAPASTGQDNVLYVEEDAGNPGFPGIYANLAAAEGADPIAVRQAWGLQKFMEEAARFGSRYPEKMRRLGSTYQGLLERPLFLGGGRQSVNFSEVLQTANDVGDRTFGVGDMYGHGIAATRSNKYMYRVPEHGYVVSMLSVRPKTLYQDGVHREFLRIDREDFHDPFLEAVGMQPVYNGELDLGHTSGHKGIFGYSDRYDEYRGHPSMVSGEFRNTLDYWHLARNLTDPVLNASFVECNPSKRIFNEQTQHSLWVMAHHRIACHRNISRNARTELT